MRIKDVKECVIFMPNDCSDVCLKHVGYNENILVKKLSMDELYLLQQYHSMYIVCDFYSASSADYVANFLKRLNELDIEIRKEICTTNLVPESYKNVWYIKEGCFCDMIYDITFIADADATDIDVNCIRKISNDVKNNIMNGNSYNYKLYIHKSLYDKYDLSSFSESRYNMIRKFDKIEDCDTMEDVKDVDFFTI